MGLHISTAAAVGVRVNSTDKPDPLHALYLARGALAPVVAALAAGARVFDGLRLHFVDGEAERERGPCLANRLLLVAVGFLILTLPLGLLFGWLGKRWAVAR